MLRSLYAAASGMYAQQVNMDLIANNLSNVNTVGYKRSRAEFQDVYYEQVLRPGDYGSPSGVQVGHGTRLAAIQPIFTDGALNPTGNPLDLAIQGNGFFRIKRADGTEAYTRDGSFRLDAHRRLVTQNGDLVLGKDGEITVPPGVDQFNIGADGRISYIDPATSAPIDLGVLTLASFSNPAGLMAMGQNVLGPTAAAGEVSVGEPGSGEFGRLAQGFIEGSNVEVVTEMVNLIIAQRAYEINSKALQASDELAGLANNLRRG